MKCLEANSWPFKSQFLAPLEDQEGDQKPEKNMREKRGRREKKARRKAKKLISGAKNSVLAKVSRFQG